MQPSKPPAEWAFFIKFWGGFIALLLALFVLAAIVPIVNSLNSPPLTPAEIRAQQEAAAVESARRQTEADAAKRREAEAKRRDAEARAETRYLCRLRRICPDYADARQACATAGNLDRCLSIKLGDANFGLIGACTHDGHVLVPADKMPNVMECFAQRIDDMLQ
jgi:hypothetical protein